MIDILDWPPLLLPEVCVPYHPDTRVWGWVAEARPWRGGYTYTTGEGPSRVTWRRPSRGRRPGSCPVRERGTTTSGTTWTYSFSTCLPENQVSTKGKSTIECLVLLPTLHSFFWMPFFASDKILDKSTVNSFVKWICTYMIPKFFSLYLYHSHPTMSTSYCAHPNYSENNKEIIKFPVLLQTYICRKNDLSFWIRYIKV